MFDTLKFARRLREAGFSEAQAEAVAEAMHEAGAEALVTMHGSRDLPIGTLKNIERITGVKLTC